MSSDNDPNYIDRRKYDRVNLRICVKYKTDGSISTEGKTVTKDVCEGGISMYLSNYVRAGDKVDLQLTLRGRYLPINASATVAWVKPRRTANEILKPAGIRFNFIGENDRKKLWHYLNDRRGEGLQDFSTDYQNLRFESPYAP